MGGGGVPTNLLPQCLGIRLIRLSIIRVIIKSIWPIPQVCQLSLSSSTLPICAIVGSENEPGDSSGLLFSIYSKMVEKEDNKRAERHQKDAEGIVLFVSPHSCLHSLTKKF
jgi:hypothetical protein